MPPPPPASPATTNTFAPPLLAFAASYLLQYVVGIGLVGFVVCNRNIRPSRLGPIKLLDLIY
jgi:hypothetical protein